MVRIGQNYQALHTKELSMLFILQLPTINRHKRSLIEQTVGIAEEVKTLSERVKMSFYTYIAFVV